MVDNAAVAEEHFRDARTYKVAAYVDNKEEVFLAVPFLGDLAVVVETQQTGELNFSLRALFLAAHPKFPLRAPRHPTKKEAIPVVLLENLLEKWVS